MNILRSREAFRRFGASVALATTLGTLACGVGAKPMPTPSPEQTATSTPANHEPLCEVKAEPGDKSRKYMFSIKMSDMFLRGKRMVQKVEYDFHDGTPNATRQGSGVAVPHTFPRPGNMQVDGSVYVQYAHGVSPDLGNPIPEKDAPHPDPSSGKITEISCLKALVVVR